MDGLTNGHSPRRSLRVLGFRSSLMLPLACSAVGVVLWFAADDTAVAGQAAKHSRPVDIQFSRDIRPILSDNCFACHGPAAKDADTDLRLDLRDEAMRPNAKDRAAIVPGKPDESELITRIHAADEEAVMPPRDSHKVLDEVEKKLLGDWIAAGANWGDHWAFETIRDSKLPPVKNLNWVRNPIDQFVLAHLEENGLAPSPESTKETLIRRVSYDLTGLPPTLDEVDAFINDKSPDAYEKIVDRYLARPAYGERMTLAWMDAARYGDSSVFHADGPRYMWGWRDWVINAYNNNMPFDQFTLEQLAGDLLPNADAWQKVASGFNRNHGTTDEGGVIFEEARVDYIVDRVKTTANVWMGLSIECAQCHDHKYDPITQKEYFAFYAFFNTSADPGKQSRDRNEAPIVTLPNPKRDAQVASLENKIKQLDEQRLAHEKAIEPQFAQWVIEQSDAVAKADEPELPGDMFVYLPLDETEGNQAADTVNAELKGKVQGNTNWLAAKNANGFKTDGSTYISFPADTANFDRTDSFSYGCWVNPTGDGAVIGKMNDGNKHRGWDLFLQNGGQLAMHLIHDWPGDAIKISTQTKVPRNQWSHVFVTYDGSSKSDGVKLYINGVEQSQRKIEADALKSTTKGAAPLNIGRRHNGAPFAGIVDDVRMYNRTLSGVEVARLAGGDPLRPILLTAADQRSEEQVNRLRSHYLSAVDKSVSQFNTDKAKLDAEIAELKKQNVTVMVMAEQPKPRQTFLLMRGNYASPDKEAGPITPDLPKSLFALPEDAPRNRLGLAQWIIADENPLTARVTVNRYWSMFFGRGLVGTVMDFGSQGEFPTHPQLLDWLARDFKSNNWNVKRTIKQILMSATYRQTSRITPRLAEMDPTNRLLTRGPRFRLQGEFIRDTALAVSGLLIDQVGGPSVKPYQPPGLWNEVALDGNVRFVQDKGDKLYRKSMYIYWKRSAPHPGMLLFDAPTRERCTVDRPRTNTPLQALYTMNDTQFMEASRMLAQRMMTEGGDSFNNKIAFACRLTTAREPSKNTIAAFADLYHAEHSRYRDDVERAKQLLAIGEHSRDETLDATEHAAWTIVASAILNMDATLTRF